MSARDDRPADSAPSDDEPQAPDELRPAYRRAFDTALRAARKVLGERFRLVRLVRSAYRKALDEESAMHTVKDDLFVLLRLMLFWAKGDYRQVSSKALLSIVGAVLYFVSPIDAIPDFIPVAGLADDVAVIAAVVRAVRGDLDRFRQWEAEHEGESISSSGEASGPQVASLPDADASTTNGTAFPSSS
jgi:uncharacterized membrane protein YkvA (DUF1232 family)